MPNNISIMRLTVTNILVLLRTVKNKWISAFSYKKCFFVCKLPQWFIPKNWGTVGKFSAALHVQIHVHIYFWDNDSACIYCH